jgi:hypothetical protein
VVVLRFRDLVWSWSFGKVMCTRVRIKGFFLCFFFWVCFEFGCKEGGEE